MTSTLIFYVFALLTIAGAVLTVVSRSAVHSALWLITSLLGTAGLFLLQSAEFLFAVQVVLYVGGIMVLFLFVIMLVNLDVAAQQRQFRRQWWLALLCVSVVGAEIFVALKAGAAGFQLAPAGTPESSVGNTEQIADALFAQYLVPFEVVSLLLLVAIVGAVWMARREA